MSSQRTMRYLPLHSSGFPSRFSLFIITWTVMSRSVVALSSLPSLSSSIPSVVTKRIAIIGGGASGIFSAVSAAEHYVKNKQHQKETITALEVVVLEATSKTLTKVAVSGGGRCNVLHDTSKPTLELLNGYPRGKKELTGLLSSRFTPQQAQEWFLQRGVKLKTEPDGRMFPTTDSSQTVIDALLKAASKDNVVDIRAKQKVLQVLLQSTRPKFRVTTQRKDTEQNKPTTRDELFDAIILATGSAPAGYQIAQSIFEQASQNVDKGTAFVSPVPSLFTLNAKLDVREEGCLLYGLSGVSVPKAQVYFKPEEKKDINSSDGSSASKKLKAGKKPAHLRQEGPLLITHHGVSGPAVLRLSAFGARDFHEANYRGTLFVHWAPDLGTAGDIANELWKMAQSNPKRLVVTGCPLTVTTTVKDSSISDKDRFAQKTIAAIPKRLWASFVTIGCEILPTTTWGEVNKKAVQKLAIHIAECQLQVTGKGTFKEEFVTAGGVALTEIDMRTMMSKSCNGFFLCGEVINVDGVTGGFNFMNCWGTGYVAGTSAVDYCLNSSEDIASIEAGGREKKSA